MAEFPAMPLWTDAYLADTKHLTCLEHGAYLLLLIIAWRAKSHTLPNDDKLLARYCGLTTQQWRRIRPRLEPFFQVEGGFWQHLRMLDELNAVRRQVAQKINAGKASALKRLHRGATAVETPLNGRSTPTPTPTKERENLNSRKEARKEGFKQMPDSLEFKAWKDHAFATNTALWRELLKREFEGRGFEFETPFPPGYKMESA